MYNSYNHKLVNYKICRIMYLKNLAAVRANIGILLLTCMHIKHTSISLDFVRKLRSLVVDESSALVSHRRSFGSYISNGLAVVGKLFLRVIRTVSRGEAFSSHKICFSKMFMILHMICCINDIVLFLTGGYKATFHFVSILLDRIILQKELTVTRGKNARQYFYIIFTFVNTLAAESNKYDSQK